MLGVTIILIFTDIFTMKRRLRDFRREQGRVTEVQSEQTTLLANSSGRVVLTAAAMY